MNVGKMIVNKSIEIKIQQPIFPKLLSQSPPFSKHM